MAGSMVGSYTMLGNFRAMRRKSASAILDKDLGSFNQRRRNVMMQFGDFMFCDMSYFGNVCMLGSERRPQPDNNLERACHWHELRQGHVRRIP